MLSVRRRCHKPGCARLDSRGSRPHVVRYDVGTNSKVRT